MESRPGEHLPPEGGFTVLELIFSIAALGLVALGLFNLYYWGVSCWRKSDLRLEGQQNARVAMDFIIRDLSFSVYCEVMPAEVIFKLSDDPDDLYRRYRLSGREIVLETGTMRNRRFRIKSHMKVARDIDLLLFDRREGTVGVTIRAGENGYMLRSAVRLRNI